MPGLEKPKDAEAPKKKPDAASPADSAKLENKGNDYVASAMSSCDGMSCTIDIQEEPWQRETDQILGEVAKDPGLKLAFNTFLREYVKPFGGEKDYEQSGDVKGNFYNAITIAGVPNSAVGFNTAMNDMLHFAAKGVENSSAKWPYERLKTVIDKVHGENKGTEIAQK